MAVDDRADIAATTVPTTEPLAELDKGDALAIFLGIERQV